MLKFHFRSYDLKKADVHSVVAVDLSPPDCFFLVTVKAAVGFVAVDEFDFVGGLHFCFPLSFLSVYIIANTQGKVNTFLC